MKFLGLAVSLLLCCLCINASLAQTIPTGISYQGKLTDTTGKPVPDSTYSVQFKLYQAATGGTAFWTSTAANVQTIGGVFTTQIQPLAAADLSGNSAVWVETVVAGQTLSPRVQFLSVPYAIQASQALSLALPYAGTLSSGSSAAFAVSASAFGDAGSFTINNTSNTATALRASSNGQGYGIIGTMTGIGEAGNFGNTSATNPSAALECYTFGTGPAVKATGTIAGDFEGKVGIGTATPDANAKLDVAGVVKMSGFRLGSSATAGMALKSDANGNGTWQSDGLTLPFSGASGGTGDALAITISNSASTGAAVRGTSNGQGAGVIGAMTGVGEAGNFGNSSASNTSAALDCWTSGTGPAVKATGTIAGEFEGKVGIGTATPATKLDVAGTVRMTGFQLGTSATAGQVLKTDATGVGTWQNDGLTLPFTGSSSSSSDALNITSSGSGNAVTGQATGGGCAGYFWTGSAGTQSTEIISNYGSNRGLFVSNNNASATAAAIEVAQSGTVSAIKSSGTIAADFEGKVGIGTATPATTLDIAGTAKMTGFQLGSTATAGQVLKSDANGVGTWQTDGLTLPYSGTVFGGSSDIFSVTSTGSGSAVVGISYGSGNGICGLANGTGGIGGYFSTVSGGIQPSVWITNYGSNNGLYVDNYNSATSSATVYVHQTSSAAAMKVLGIIAADFEGRVGIGTGTNVPSGSLEVVSSGKLAGNFHQDSTTANVHALDVANSGLSDCCNFQVNNASNNASGIFMADNGQGNGILSYMSGNGRAGYFQIDKSDNSLAALECKTIGTGPAFKATGTVAADFEGNVGIGTGTPTSGFKLDVIGTARCQSLTQYSDVRFKNNIRPIADALASTLKLRGVTYTWRKDEFKNMNFSDGQQIGFVAQDVEKVLPEIVSKDDKGFESVAYDRVVPVLVEAVKELDSQNKAKDAKISDLEARLSRLEKLVSQQKGGM